MRVGELRSLSLFDGLTDDQLAELFEGSTEVRIEPGVDLFHQGEHADFWWVLLDGAIDLVRHIGREDTVVGKMDVPGRWAGGFRAWDEHGVYLATGRGAAGGFSALDTLRRQIEPGMAVQDPLALADQEEALSLWLARHGIAREWALAPPLAAAGVDLAWCERAALMLEGPALEAGLEWVASTLSAATLLSEMKESSRRISGLVAAIKSYSQMDRASMQRIDVTEGLESTLVMLGHKLRDGVTVIRDYGADVPRIEAHAGELNQVWTNLIDNAIDAMDGAGTLRLVTRAEGNDVVIEVGDTGPSMPPQVAARAFEAFYTAKDVGKGTGLGLDIAQRIVVERHGGTITIHSQPGQTVLRVRIPARPGRATAPPDS